MTIEITEDQRQQIAGILTTHTPVRDSFYPLVEWGWTRSDCIDYLYRTLGIIWKKSACIQCPFNALKADALARHPEQVAEAMLLEHVSLALNPRGTLYRNQSLIEITDASGNALASASFRRTLEQQPWTVYRVRRLYRAGKDKEGRLSPAKKGNAIRAVERLTPDMDRATALESLRVMTHAENEIIERRDIRYVYRQRCAATFPTREEFLVAAAAAVETKARYGLEWFERQWDAPQRSLFE